MMNIKFSPTLLATISGLLLFVAIGENNFVAGCICLVPLFISTFDVKQKKIFINGFITGLIFSCFAYMWIIKGAERFTGYSFLYGIAVFLICAVIAGLYWGCLIWCTALIKLKKGKFALLFNCIGIAAIFCLYEFVWSQIMSGMPWFNFFPGNSFLGNLFAVQPASIFGMSVISFIVVVVNYLFAYFFYGKQWKKLSIPVAVLLLYLLSGYIIFESFNNKGTTDKTVRIAVLSENILPDIKWDDNNGNMLVQRLLDLNKAAVAQEPDIILWSESAIPWTFRKDDDLVSEILKESHSSGATHILGMNSEVENNVVNNSAYCLLPNGEIAGRYDKQQLLSFIEKPISGMNIPFFSSKGFFVSENASHAAPLATPYGKAGIMICNESLIENSARDAAKKGAEFLCNMSNDGWFNDTYIVKFHFLNTRLRAVETRKDVVVNSNNGYSGVINANGEIIQQQRDTDPFVQVNGIHPNNFRTWFVQFPNLFIYLCLAITVFVIIRKRL
ncbi:MAG: apolipoprotein N-acyltransferase [Bacteroidetes bacterium]|nr:apolipoprotein N-acyltransferase [Bacteroidota bacterium]